MKKIGEIILILNEKFAVLRASEPLILGSEVLVYKETKLDEVNKTKTGIADINIPKGKLKVLMLQNTNIYLVSVVTKRSAEQNPDNQNLARSLSLYNSIFGHSPNELDNSGSETADYSAKLDVSKSLKMEYNPLVIPGDSVAFQQPVQNK